MRTLHTSLWVVLAWGACASACGTSRVASDFRGGDGASAQTGQDGSDSGPFGFSTGDDDGGGFFAGNGDGGGAPGACAYSTTKAQQRPLDVYVMLDQSLSMLGPKWKGVTGAINSFVMQPLSDVSVGIQYFALDLISCTASDYATPEVEIAPLPGVASKISASLAAHTPSTVTPTLAAEQGAVEHAQDWAKAHPGDAVVVVLATDGDPDSCNILPDPVTPVAKAAAAGVSGTPKILTFVIGVGSDTTNLNAIAQAGGTNAAYIVDTSMNVNSQFLAALNKIRGSALGCQYKIPAPTSGTVDFTEVNVQFMSTAGMKTVFPQVPDKAHCPSSGNAWYYDDPLAPTQIVLCATSCGTVTIGGEVDVLTGCMTIVK